MPSAGRGRGSRRSGRGDTAGALTFCDFVDDALFHPRWGYYSTGGVQFGTGGHYDTYPLALSPLFGHMVAHYAYGAWRRAGLPRSFELCELGAGNGQLCLDTLLWVHERARHDRSWKAFAGRLRYRIVERSPALAGRQRQQLGPLAEAVVWSRCDPSRRAPSGVPFASHGVIVANEVLDCLPHHKLLPGAGGPQVATVVPSLAGRPLDRARLAAAMTDPRRRGGVRFREGAVPIARLPALAAYAKRQFPELFGRRPPRLPYLACLRFDTLMRATATFYDEADALWLDYGERRDFHRRAPESRRLFAGSPRSGRGVYDDPGRDDITFLIDFSAVEDAARHAGWSVKFYGPQAALSRLGHVRIDRAAVELIIRHRALRWMLALAGVGPEQSWQRPAVTWSPGPAAGRVPVRRYVERSVREFRDRASVFKLLVLRKAPDAARRRQPGATARSARRTSAARRRRR